jgi:hypothetical protein
MGPRVRRCRLKTAQSAPNGREHHLAPNETPKSTKARLFVKAARFCVAEGAD